MYVSHTNDRTITPYNTAYLRDDRTHLYDEYEIDRSDDCGTTFPETGDADAPHDMTERRAAILSFYGHRCGRCLTEIAPTTATTDAELGYIYSLAHETDEDGWALENLVPLCESCYEVCSIVDPNRLDRFDSAYRDSQQFPQWLGDPRVAVERIPLSGRERWVREQLVAHNPVRSGEQDGAVNEAVATRACLARETPASTAIAFGERLSVDAWQPMPTEQRLTERWETLSECEKASYERRAEDRRALIEGAFVPAKP